jgi:hypothetical protein
MLIWPILCGFGTFSRSIIILMLRNLELGSGVVVEIVGDQIEIIPIRDAV